MDEPEFKEIDIEKEESEELITEPFDPKAIDIAVEQRSLDSIFARIKHDEINLNTEFQRAGNLWSATTMSRLIESVLVRFPLPAFYFDGSEDDCWLVVDGLQRLCTFKRFVVDCEIKDNKNPPLKLVGLEFLKDYNGLTFDKLPHSMHRRMKETQITTYFIKPNTPLEVKYSIFYRINTGGLILNAQEIRHTLNQKGPASTFLKQVAEMPAITRIVNVSPKRMQDRELVLRHMAFRLSPYTDYKPPMKRFLNNAMKELGQRPPEELTIMQNQFISSLEASEHIFGEHAFSKSLAYPGQKPTLNRGLFEVMTVLFAEMSDEQKNHFISQREKFLDIFKNLLKDREFDGYISASTTDSKSVKERFTRIKKLVQGL